MVWIEALAGVAFASFIIPFLLAAFVWKRQDLKVELRPCALPLKELLILILLYTGVDLNFAEEVRLRVGAGHGCIEWYWEGSHGETLPTGPCLPVCL